MPGILHAQRMTLRDLMGNGAPEVEVSGLAYSSRSVSPGTLFFCVPGFRADGHDFAPDAVARQHELQVGLAFKPGTEPEQVAEVAEPFDIVLCMSIEPGYSGQPFMPEALSRIEQLRGLIPDDKPIQVDDGVRRRRAAPLLGELEGPRQMLVHATSATRSS